MTDAPNTFNADQYHLTATLGQRIFARTAERFLPKAIIDKVNVWDQKFALSVMSVVLMLLVLLFMAIWPSIFPFSFLEFWTIEKWSNDVFWNAWPLFAWGVGVTTIVSLVTRNEAHHNRFAEQFLSKGFAISLMAGVFEEIVFRWLLFFLAIPLVIFLNGITFGLYGWFYETVLGPIADVTSLGKLHHMLFGEYGWVIGAAIVSANAQFRNGHTYQGLLGLINSWFIGMFLFLIMFEHGLPMAIAIHFLYDMFIFVVRYVDAAIERMLGWD